MSIVAMRKLTLLAPLSDKERLLERLQALGCLHLVSLRPTPKEPENAPTPRAEQAYKALRYLEGTARKRRTITHDRGFDMHALVEQALDNQQRLRETVDQCDFLRQRIRNLEPWGDFRLPDADALLGRKLWFYILPVGQLGQLEPLRAIGIPWATVYRDNRQAYVVLIAAEEPPAGLLPVARIHTGRRSLGELNRELEEAEIALEELQAEREALTRWRYLLRQNLNRAEDRAAMDYARVQTLDDDALCAIQGWLPEPRVTEMEAFAERHGLAMTHEAPSASDRPPTLYDNPEALAGGQELIDFYQTPGYRSWDPSTVVFFSFALFFAMILADAGYAAVLGLLLAWRWRSMGQSDTGRRLRLLATVVVGASLLYGTLVGSFFGSTPQSASPLADLHLLDMGNFDLMMRVSILVGAAHVALANGLVAWNARLWRHRLAPLGWIAVVLGGLALWFGAPDSAPQMAGWGGIGAGLLAVLLFSDPAPLRLGKALLRRLLTGLISLSNLTKIFGDILSYMRLFALGLASASLALTFNQLAEQVAQAVSGLGLLLSLLILLLGHTLNLGLAVMSGVVHGLRLNFIEFFNWGISEEGYPFKPFLKKEKRNG